MSPNIKSGSGVRTVVSGAKTAPDDDRQLRYIGACDSADHLCAVLRNTTFFSFRSHHVAFEKFVSILMYA